MTEFPVSNSFHLLVRNLPLAGHGGGLLAARQAYPQAPEPWLDLSTGVSPYAYPFERLPKEIFTRLPEPEEVYALEATAKHAYQAPRHAEVVAAPGTQAIINWLPRLATARRVGILGFTYCEHARRWDESGAYVVEAVELAALKGKDVAIVVNPNNPDGRVIPPSELLELAGALASRGGLLIIDEAFADFLGPAASLAPVLPSRGAVVLRSFGKTYGLPGLRLGFAIAPRPIAEKLRVALGPWPVSGPAIAAAEKALLDAQWLAAARARLEKDAAALDRILAEAGLARVGGTPLFRLVGHKNAQRIFDHLAGAGILVRRFAARPDWLRFGILAQEKDRARLRAALRAAL